VLPLHPSSIFTIFHFSLNLIFHIPTDNFPLGGICNAFLSPCLTCALVDREGRKCMLDSASDFPPLFSGERVRKTNFLHKFETSNLPWMASKEGPGTQNEGGGTYNLFRSWTVMG
jgi:hypothetical protein